MTFLILQKIHQKLLPEEKELGWQPYVWLVYLSIYFFSWPFREVSTTEIIASGIGIACFLPLYFSAFHRHGTVLIAHIVAIMAIGMVLVHFNLGASVFFIYAASFCSSFHKPAHGAMGIISICIVVALYAWLLSLPIAFVAPAIFFSATIGFSNIYFVQMAIKNAQLRASQDEIRQLATVAERERIARDLHDLIGHSFSLLSKKAELARKLIQIDADKATSEIAEIESLARDSLAQVREAVTGYRKRDLSTELASAKALCRASDISLTLGNQDIVLTAEADQVLAFCLREALTNVTRHSNADAVQIKFECDDHYLHLHIMDNGSGGQSIVYGNGLTGMKERIESISGKLTINNDDGVHLTFSIPNEVLI